jgi:hypothetical protein
MTTMTRFLLQIDWGFAALLDKEVQQIIIKINGLLKKVTTGQQLRRWPLHTADGVF